MFFIVSKTAIRDFRELFKALVFEENFYRSYQFKPFRKFYRKITITIACKQ
jgi:hypothetical protein